MYKDKNLKIFMKFVVYLLHVKFIHNYKFCEKFIKSYNKNYNFYKFYVSLLQKQKFLETLHSEISCVWYFFSHMIMVRPCRCHYSIKMMAVKVKYQLVSLTQE